MDWTCYHLHHHHRVYYEVVSTILVVDSVGRLRIRTMRQHACSVVVVVVVSNPLRTTCFGAVFDTVLVEIFDCCHCGSCCRSSVSLLFVSAHSLYENHISSEEGRTVVVFAPSISSSVFCFGKDSVFDRTMPLALSWDARTNWSENFEMHNQMMPFEEPQTVMYFSW